ncbi:acyltransferase [Moritella sp.]|uniref:acyltransferase n=1 Tax=Moritella sp. TaxID=78556 RepID=UPI001DE8756B|nr:acyltransferase [Moritella sp.]MCJ8347943.1 acyltransferase [Moritella sp.]NQZ40384.1 acyltransferase [Moritella sp.]
MGFYSRSELYNLGLKKVGVNVKVSNKVSIYNPQNIVLGDNVRIDDFCVISAGEEGIILGRNVHIACFSSLIGQARIELGDFSGVSSRVSIYSSSDDYLGHAMTNPTVPQNYTKVEHKNVIIGRHAIIGAGSIVLPGADISEGVAIGALSLVKGSCSSWFIYGGNPLQKLVKRRKGCLIKENEYLLDEKNNK